MEYIMEAANMVKNNNSLLKSNILVKNNKVHYMKEGPFTSSRSMRMDISPYVLTPGHVMIVDNLEQMPFLDFKQYITENYLKKGCTTLLSLITIQREQDLLPALKKARTNLLNSPLDYYFAVRIPLKRLTASFARQCRRQKISAVFLQMEDDSEFPSIPWGWVKDSLYQFPITFLPCWQNLTSSKKAKKKKEWKVMMKKERLSHSIHCPEAGKPLDLDLLMKIGIYPTKGELRVGGELDYNLYLSPEGHIIETIENLDYDSHIPEVTVNKGTIIRVGEDVLFRPGFGNECTVTMPGHFLLNEKV
ncbi:hypothetical protein [Sutcliffiella horikoshii]|uniref:hypothetical protein n=1 Tax=Sutcliffiella horikoshii TaxID=79883 RepID=UPI001F35C7E9|nr:hypothetical protein [Sutcliffiella horikoshii]MCG1023053.1 hypothetical protein [Sutcliffiella horikoshii]